MSSPFTSPTSTSLILRAQSLDADAWERMARLYTPLVFYWTQVAKLQDADAADVVQDVFEALAKNLSNFDHGPDRPPFRGWLYGITRNKIRMHFRGKEKNAHAAGGTDAHKIYMELPEVEEVDGDDSSIASQNSLARRALELIQTDFHETTWQAFWRVAIDERPAAEVAEELGLSVGGVYTAKSRVLKRLRTELDGLV